MSLHSRSGAHLSAIRDDDVLTGYAPLITVVSGGAQIIDLTLATAFALGRLLIAAAGDEGYREHLIAAGHLAPGARSMPLADAIDQHNAVNALDSSDPDYLHPPASAATLADAVDLIPDSWHDGIVADAAGQGCTLSYTAATSGLRVGTLRRVQRHFAAREDDADWQALSAGQQLDECFPEYNGIGALDLLAELGLVPVYHLRDC